MLKRAVIESAGGELTAGQCKTEAELIELTRDADAVINQYALLTPKVISAMERCRVIVRYGIGVDTIDIPAAGKAGIMVCNVPTYGIHEVSDHTICLFLASVRKIEFINKQVKNGVWNCNLTRPINRIHKTVFGFRRVRQHPSHDGQKTGPLGNEDDRLRPLRR